jgi:sporulation protein YlmC with PRC-barrel domain
LATPLRPNIGKSVLSEDGRKLGILLNLTLNKSTFFGSLVVFPGLSIKKMRDPGFLKKITRTIFGEVKKEISPQLSFGDVLFSFEEDAIDLIMDQIGLSLTEAEQTYFIIPCGKIKEIHQDTITLTEDMVYCKRSYRDRSTNRKTDIAFFGENYARGWTRPVPLNLWLDPLRDATIYDPSEKSAKLVDLMIEPRSGRISHLIFEWGAVNKAVETELVEAASDENERVFFKCKKALEGFPQAPETGME